MGHLLYSVESADVVKGINAGRQAAVQAEDLIVDKGGEREVVEKIREGFPHVGISILSEAFIVESVHLSDLAGFVIATENRNALRIPNLQGDKQSHSLHREIATIDVVAHEEIIGIWVGSANLEQLHQVMELTVYISANSDWTANRLNIVFCC